MEHIAIEARPRPGNVTKGERNRLRRLGHIPAAVFGKGMDPVMVTIEAREIARVLHAATGVNTLIDLTVEGGRHLVRVSEVEIDPVHRTLLHVGLHKIAANEAQKATVPIEIVGEPEDVRMGTALLETGLSQLDVRCLPGDVPSSLVLDVSDMQTGDTRHASDLTLPARVELLSPPDTSIVSVRTKAAMVEEVAEAAEEQPAEEGAAAS
jgi:large subunit ribosomal protein L25